MIVRSRWKITTSTIGIRSMGRDFRGQPENQRQHHAQQGQNVRRQKHPLAVGRDGHVDGKQAFAPRRLHRAAQDGAETVGDTVVLIEREAVLLHGPIEEGRPDIREETGLHGIGLKPPQNFLRRQISPQFFLHGRLLYCFLATVYSSPARK